MPARRLLALTLLAGCAPGDYRAETEVRPDGAVARTVRQNDLPGTVAEIRDRWEARRQAAPADAAEWKTPLAEGPEPARGRTGVVATVVAPSAAELPDAVRISEGALYGYIHQYDIDVPPATTERSSAVTAYGVLTLYDWNETLTAGTDPVRMERARREGVRAAAELAELVLERGLGEGADASGLADWVRTTGDHWTADLQAAFFAEAVKPGRLGDLPGDRFRTIARDYGLDAPDHREDAKAAREAGEAFAENLLRTHVTVNGEPLNGETLDRAMGLLWLRGAAPDFFEVWDAAFAARSGSTEKGRAAVIQHLADSLGPLALVTANPTLAYRHRTPGLLLETSGSVLSPGGDGEPAEVLFRFPLQEAWPFGAAMTCRSVVFHPDRQRALLGEVVIDDRAAAVRFLQRMERAATREAWLAAVGAGDGKVLRELWE